MHRSAADAFHGSAGRRSGQGEAHEYPAGCGSATARLRATEVLRRQAGPALGGGLHLRCDLIGFRFVAFVIDVFLRMIIGCSVSASMSAKLILDALEQALWARKVKGNLIHHSDRGSQYQSIRYTEWLAEIDPLGCLPLTGQFRL